MTTTARRRRRPRLDPSDGDSLEGWLLGVKGDLISVQSVLPVGVP
jgi:hypothetical protein